MDKNSKILVLGSGGMVGSSICRQLKNKGYENILSPKRSDVDLLDKNQVYSYFSYNAPEYVSSS